MTKTKSIFHPTNPEEYEDFTDMAEELLGYEQQWVYVCTFFINGHCKGTKLLNCYDGQTWEDLRDLLACIEPGIVIDGKLLEKMLDEITPEKPCTLNGKGVSWFGGEAAVMVSMEPVIGAVIADDSETLYDAASDMEDLDEALDDGLLAPEEEDQEEEPAQPILRRRGHASKTK